MSGRKKTQGEKLPSTINLIKKIVKKNTPKKTIMKASIKKVEVTKKKPEEKKINSTDIVKHLKTCYKDDIRVDDMKENVMNIVIEDTIPLTIVGVPAPWK